MDQLSQMDTVFLRAESSTTPLHTAGVVVFDGPLEFTKVYETLEARMHLIPRFTQRVAEVPFGLGYPFWVSDPEFDLSFHLRHGALPAPGDDDQLCDYAARLVSRPLDRSKPLWEAYVVDGLEGGRSAMVIKTHHAMVDGISTMDLATVLFDLSPEPSVPPHTDRPRVEAPPSAAALLRDAVARQARTWMDLGAAARGAAAAPQRMISGLRETAGAAVTSAASLLRPASASPLNRAPGLHRRYAVVRSTLQTFKDIKNVAGASVNDVILTVGADALGRWFRGRGESTEARSLRTMVPVSVRDEAGRMSLGNEIVAVAVDLPIGRMKPLDRLEVIHDQMKDVKDSKRAAAADLIVNMSRWAPATLHALAARLGSRLRLMNLIISNVPGPQVPLYSCGVKMLEPYAVIPLSSTQSLAIGVTSYNGGIFFGLNADRDAHPDLRDLARAIEDSIGDLEKGAAERSSESVTHAETEFASGGELGH